MEYSIVVPLHNEAGNVVLLHKKIIQALTGLHKNYEVIFVDDCSTDQTLMQIKHLSPLTVISLRTNKGQTAALDAGIKESSGKYIITLDGDLQNDPADIPQLIKYLETNDLDVVSGWRVNRKDPFMKRFLSRGAHYLRSIMVRDGIHDSGCSLKIYKRECFATLDLYGEMHRFIPALLKIRGFRIGEMPVNHFPRHSGTTKYNWKRTVKGILDMLSVWFWHKYLNRPMHLLGGIGLAFWLAGLILVNIIVYMKLTVNIDLSDNAMTEVALFFFFFGLNFILFGLLFDMVSKIYYSGCKESSYLIKEITRNGKQET